MFRTILIAGLFPGAPGGRGAPAASGVEEALGRKPVDFADHARRTAASGIWEARD